MALFGRVCCALVLGLLLIPASHADVSNVREIVITSSSNSSDNILQIAEVIAIATGSNTDVALASQGATVTAVAVYQNRTSGPFIPAHAIDGRADPGDRTGNFYHSELAQGQTLTVRLSAEQTLSSITLVGRGDCCSGRDVFDVELRDSTGGTLTRFASLNANNDAHQVQLRLQGPDEVGRWGEPLPWPLVPVSMANLPDGRILTYSGSERRTWPSTEQTYSATWNPLDGSFDETLHVGHNMFCGTLSMLDDGRVFVAGGRNQGNSPWTSTYDADSSSWLQIENMASGGRWYPTTLALGDGSVLTAMGSATNVRNPDLWSADTGWRVLNGIDFISMRQRRNERGRMSWFPQLSQAPNGDVYHFWDTVENHFVSPVGNGLARSANPDTDSTEHSGGVQVMYDEGRLLMSGANQNSWGGNSSEVTALAFTVDLNGANPVIRSTGTMSNRRKYHQMLTLPTGEVFTLGGNTTGQAFSDNGSVYDTEIWNPTTGEWRLAAPITVPRNYHSTALLLTDGRIIAAGGGYSSGNANLPATHMDAQIYSPAYLFLPDGTLAPRPSIESDLSEVNYGQTFGVATSGNIDYFSLIRMSATTHATNTDHRQFRPSFTDVGNGRYAINMHANPNVATPGYWMLFAIDNNGVPSEAAVIRVAADVEVDPSEGEPPDVQPISTSPVPIAESNNFSVTASGNNLLYSWNFGDGSGDSAFSSDNSITHTFSSPGRYVVSVTVRTPTGQQTVQTFTQVVYGTLTDTRARVSSTLLELEALNQLWNVNPDNNSVSVADTGNLNRIAEITVGQNPRSLAQAPDQRVWVVNKDDATISVIDVSGRTVVQTLTLDQASRPHGIVFNEHSAYVSLEALSVIVQLDAATGDERRRVSVGNMPRYLSMNAVGDTLYVTDFIAAALPGEDGLSPQTASAGAEVHVLGTSSTALSLQTSIALQYSDRDITENQGPGIPNYLGPAVISPDGLTAWVPSKQDNIVAGERRGNEGITFDQTVRAVTSRLRLDSNTEWLAARVDHDNASIASHAAYGPYGLTLFASLEGNRQVALIDTTSNLEYARFDTGHAPQSLLLSADAQRLYVHNFMDRSVSVHDISNAVELGSTQVEQIGVIDSVVSERLSAEVMRGKQLFYDARDDRLAGLDYMACAACHNDGEGDGRVWDFSSLGEGLRNTSDLRGNGALSGDLHWSANFDEVQDFEAPIRAFAGGAGLMDDADFNFGSRSNPLGLRKAGISADLDALAAYVESLDTALPSPYRMADGALTASGVQGRALFASNGCAVCHAGDKFTDSAAGVRHDIGTLTALSGERSGGVFDAVDTPSLLGVWKTRPYLHDGSAATIEAAIAAHAGVSLSAAELNSVADYVRQIDSREPAVVPAPVDPDPDPAPPVDPLAFSTPAAIVVDGERDDWPLEAAFGTDPQDATGGNNELDYERGWMAHDADNLYVRYDNHAPNNPRLTWGYSFSVDVDGIETGYNDGYLPIGVDYLIEAESVYRYTGDGSSWSWAWIANVPVVFNGRSAELSVARSLIGNPETFDFFFYADNTAIGGTAVDFFPDAVPDSDAETHARRLRYAFGGETPTPPVEPPPEPEPPSNNDGVFHNAASGITLDGNISDWAALRSFGADPDDIAATDNVVDFLEAWAASDEQHFYFAWTNDGPGNLTWGNAIYIDTDLNAATGFRGFLDESPIGIEYLAEADAVYRYTGNGNNWSWELVGPTELRITGNTLELRIDASLLDNVQTIDLFFYGDSSALGSTGIDFYPDAVTDTDAILTTRRFRYTRDANQGNSVSDTLTLGAAR